MLHDSPPQSPQQSPLAQSQPSQAVLQRWQSMLAYRRQELENQEDLERVDDALFRLPATLRPRVLVPIGSVGFVRARLSRPNHVLVNLGAGVFTERSVAQARDIVHRRLATVDAALQNVEHDMRSLLREVAAPAKRPEIGVTHDEEGNHIMEIMEWQDEEGEWHSTVEPVNRFVEELFDAQQQLEADAQPSPTSANASIVAPVDAQPEPLAEPTTAHTAHTSPSASPVSPPEASPEALSVAQTASSSSSSVISPVMESNVSSAPSPPSPARQEERPMSLFRKRMLERKKKG